MVLCCGDEGPGVVRDVRVWPGAEGLELFRLQLHALLGGPAHEDDVSFVVRIGREDALILLPGLSSYVVASYCAALGAVLGRSSTALGVKSVQTAEPQRKMEGGYEGSPREPQLPQQCKADALPTGPAADSFSSEDDWINLLCSVADLLEGEVTAMTGNLSQADLRKGPTMSAAEARTQIVASTMVTVWVYVRRRVPSVSELMKPRQVSRMATAGARLLSDSSAGWSVSQPTAAAAAGKAAAAMSPQHPLQSAMQVHPTQSLSCGVAIED
ncbi:hypothetical protein VaNZ11_010929 [Volvox africanus]|uniref:Uncharacterized protein n=1 Tax=Volvox africanus TaxID=51714 RepID=A0ABQ5SAF2_9CHLO|nr:hypothetical protein VaNZ11_010929 [Volvox africanus]